MPMPFFPKGPAVTGPDLFASQWQDISSLLADQPTTASKTEAVSDRRIARLQARAAEKRTNRHDAIQVRAEERRTLREDRRAARAEARELRAEKREDRAGSADRARARVLVAGRSVLVTGPILAPMAVAWTGQSQFATQILGWAFAASVLYAAAYELTTAYWAWLYHQARSDGDSGLEYRLGTWVFATGAAVQQWWHYSDHWAATPRAVTYSVMSGVGVLSWEGLARLVHRRKLRSENKLAPARPRIGLARWVRYPVRSWTAWSLITLEGHLTLGAAWTAADAALRSRELDRAARSAAREAARPVRTGPRWTRRSAGPASGPEVVTAQPSRTALPAAPAGPLGPVRTASVPVSLTKTVRSTGPVHTAGPVRTAKSTAAPAQAVQAVQARSGPVKQPTGPLALSHIEQEAVDRLRSANRPISKRSIAEMVRTDLGQSISSDRAADIARHLRSLRSA